MCTAAFYSESSFANWYRRTLQSHWTTRVWRRDADKLRCSAAAATSAAAAAVRTRDTGRKHYANAGAQKMRAFFSYANCVAHCWQRPLKICEWQLNVVLYAMLCGRRCRHECSPARLRKFSRVSRVRRALKLICCMHTGAVELLTCILQTVWERQNDQEENKQVFGQSFRKVINGFLVRWQWTNLKIQFHVSFGVAIEASALTTLTCFDYMQTCEGAKRIHQGVRPQKHTRRHVLTYAYTLGINHANAQAPLPSKIHAQIGAMCQVKCARICYVYYVQMFVNHSNFFKVWLFSAVANR